MTFGEKVRTSRKKLSMTQDQLARTLGVSRRVICLYEANQIRPGNQSRYMNLAEALHVNVNYLLTDDDQLFEGTTSMGIETRRGCDAVLNQIGVLFSGGNLPEEDMDNLMHAIQNTYIEAKARLLVEDKKKR